MASAITVSSLVITSGFGQNFAKWAYVDPNYNGLPYLQLDAVELHAATSNNRSLATKVAEGPTDTYHVTGDGSARYYWIRARDKSGGFGEWHPVSPTGGVVAAASAHFAVDENDPGYVKFPNGFMLAFGKKVCVANTPTAVTFALPFNQISIAMAMQLGVDVDPTAGVVGWDTSSVTLQSNTEGSLMIWLALGSKTS